MAHADACSSCARELKEMQAVRAMLGGLKRVTVSSAFDFEMSRRLREEQRNLQSPWYSLKLVVRENLSKFIVIPAATMMLIGALAVYHAAMIGGAGTGAPESVQLKGEGVELVMDENEPMDMQVNYVLEKMNPGDVEMEFWSPSEAGAAKIAPGTQDITLISF